MLASGIVFTIGVPTGQFTGTCTVNCSVQIDGLPPVDAGIEILLNCAFAAPLALPTVPSVQPAPEIVGAGELTNVT